MTTLNNKTSLRVPYQLPEFIREEESYQTFVAFLQAYYEWLEQQDIGDGKQGVTYGTNNLTEYMDIDTTMPAFVEYFLNDFLPNFPTDALADKEQIVKYAKQLYAIKGTPASYQFLFRALYNSDCDIFTTRDVLLKTSDGKWYVSKSLKLASSDISFIAAKNLRLFGERSKSIATVERAILNGNKTEVFITDIERLFESGEHVRVVDSKNQPVLFLNGVRVPDGTPGSSLLRAKIVGSISSLKINPKSRGQLYIGRSDTYPGDPVVLYGGLDNPLIDVGAEAFILETTSGSIRDVSIQDKSYGYREDPNTYIRFIGGGGKGAIANVGSVDPSREINVAFIAKDYVGIANAVHLNANYAFFANTIADINCSLANAFSFTSFSTYGIDSILINNGGGGYTALPQVVADSLYDTTDPNLIPNMQIKGKLASLGILGPITINDGGIGYANGDIIQFLGGAGTGAHANVTVNSGGTIVSTQYVYTNTVNGIVTFPMGGMGYKNARLPELRVVSANGSNAFLSVATVLGDGAGLTAVADERGIGAITSFVIENFGEDYTSAPSVSLKVRDMVVSNVTILNLPLKGDKVYQGSTPNTSSFEAFVDSIQLLSADVNHANSTYLMRTYNYNAATSNTLPLKIENRPAGPNIYPDLVTTYNTVDENGNSLFTGGIRNYGNGAAKATAKFLNGLIIGDGQYINDDGFPSSYHLLQSEDINNFTYQLAVEKSYSVYKSVMMKLLHPAGMKVLPVNALKAVAENGHVDTESYAANSHTLSYYTGNSSSNAVMTASFTNPTSNSVKFNSLFGATIQGIIAPNSYISLTSAFGPNVYSRVESVNTSSNTVIIQDSVFLRYANVAIGTSVSNANVYINSLTGGYDLINNGQYANTKNKLAEIVHVGDAIRVYANATHDYTGTVTVVNNNKQVLTVTPAITFSSTTALVSTGRNLVSTDVDIFNTLFSPYIPELITEDGNSLAAEDGRIIILG